MKRWAVARVDEYEPGSIDWRFSQYPGVRFRYWEKYPELQWGMGQIATNNLAQFSADPQIFILPDSTMDASWSTIPASVRNTVRSRVEAAGLQFSVQNSWPVRQVLHYIVHQIQPGIDIEAGDVQDIE